MKIIRKIFLCTLIIFQLLLTGCEKKEEPYLAYFNKGEAYFYDKNNPKAIEYFDKSIAENSNYPMSYEYRAMTYLELKEYGKAEKDLKVAISKYENEDERISAYYVMFVLYSRQAKFDKAFEYLDRSLNVTNGSAIKRFLYGDKTDLSKRFLQLYGTDLIQEGNIEKAHNLFLKSIKYYPDEYFGYFGLAYIEKNYYKNNQKAEKYLKKGRAVGRDQILRDRNLSPSAIRNSLVDDNINKKQ